MIGPASALFCDNSHTSVSDDGDQIKCITVIIIAVQDSARAYAEILEYFWF